jgi:hypothetical protein
MAEVDAPDLRVVGEEAAGSEDLVEEYLANLSGRSAATVEVYRRVLRSPQAQPDARGGSEEGLIRPYPGFDEAPLRHYRTIFPQLVEKRPRIGPCAANLAVNPA